MRAGVLEYQIVTKTYLLSYLCDSSDSCESSYISDSSDSCDSSDISDSSDSFDSSDSNESIDSSDSSDEKKFNKNIHESFKLLFLQFIFLFKIKLFPQKYLFFNDQYFLQFSSSLTIKLFI